MAKQELMNREAEEALLGSVLTNPPLLTEVRTTVSPDDFFIVRHKHIWEAVCELADEGSGIDLLTLDEKVSTSTTDYGGPSFLTKLINSVPTTLHIEEYAAIVHEYGTRRRLLNAAGEIGKAVYNKEKTVDQVIDISQNALIAAAFSGGGSGPVTLKQALSKHQEDVAKAQAGQIKAVPTGILDLDKKLAGGFRPATINVWAAFTGVGKTASAVTVAKNHAEIGGRPVFFSAEMPATRIVNRLVAPVIHVATQRFDIPGSLSSLEITNWGNAVTELEKLGLFIDDTPTPGVSYICNQVKRLRALEGIDLVIIDYLQLVRPSQTYRMRYLEVKDVLERLHATARQLEIPFLVMAQIGRVAARRQDKRPILSDLRESGDIEQFAYSIVLMHRDEYWDATTLNKGVAELNVAKHRDGDTGMVQCIFRGEYSRLENAVFKTINLNPGMGATI